MNKSCQFLLLAFLLVPCVVHAQDKASSSFTVGGEIRYRSEMSGQSFNPGADPSALHLLRTRVGLGFHPADDLEAYVEVQDAREFGGGDPAAARGTQDGSADAIDFHQAYFTVRNLFATPFQVKVGRQKLDYGNTRLIGSSDWGAIGRTFDAGVLSYERGQLKGDVFVARLTRRVDSQATQSLFGTFITLEAADALAVDTYALFDDNTERIQAGPAAGRRKLVRQTAGARLYGKVNRFDYEAEGIYQWGHTGTEARPEQKIRAYLLAAEAKVRVLDRLRLGALVNQLSGDDNPADGYTNTFNTLFATNHSRYGILDYFPGVASAAGFTDLGLTAEATVATPLVLRAEIHHFEAGAGIATAHGTATDFGQEVSLQATLKYNKNLTLAGGGAAFRSGAAMKALDEERPTHWLFLMATVKL